MSRYPLGGIYIFSESLEERGSAIWLSLRDSSTLFLKIRVNKKTTPILFGLTHVGELNLYH
jgi:hypothetical protein